MIDDDVTRSQLNVARSAWRAVRFAVALLCAAALLVLGCRAVLASGPGYVAPSAYEVQFAPESHR